MILRGIAKGLERTRQRLRVPATSKDALAWCEVIETWLFRHLRWRNSLREEPIRGVTIVGWLRAACGVVPVAVPRSFTTRVEDGVASYAGLRPGPVERDKQPEAAAALAAVRHLEGTPLWAAVALTVSAGQRLADGAKVASRWWEALPYRVPGGIVFTPWVEKTDHKRKRVVDPMTLQCPEGRTEDWLFEQVMGWEQLDGAQGRAEQSGIVFL